MSEILTFSADEVAPDRTAVFTHQDIPADATVSADVEEILRAAQALFLESAEPVGIMSEIAGPDFEYVYNGEGRNEPSTPVADIFVQADDLILFALTLGERISREIEERFASNDFALACMLDSVASAAADKMVHKAEGGCVEFLSSRGRVTAATRVLSYSPGYCGWHISGQKRLFGFLRPEQIGVLLRKSFLMEPLKSVSGVMIAGPGEIHRFQNSYHYCMACETHGCRERIRTLLAE